MGSQFGSHSPKPRFKVKVTFHPVRLVLFIAVFLVLAYFFS